LVSKPATASDACQNVRRFLAPGTPIDEESLKRATQDSPTLDLLRNQLENDQGHLTALQVQRLAEALLDLCGKSER
jgi:hypothetical protein